MADLLLTDAVWFGAHPDETHRARHATAQERAAFPFVGYGNPMHLTVVRARDGARATYAFPDDCDLTRACSDELAAMFDDDLDSGRAEPR